jgi:type IV pilus assembly protein PilE
MKTLQTKRIFGFTLIELMIVVGVVAILLALAYPNYIQYVRKAKRGDAQQLLMNWAINQEIFRSNHTLYGQDSTDPALGMPAPAHDYYTFNVESITATTYELSATATGDQLNDKSKDGAVTCSPLRLNQNGQKCSGAVGNTGEVRCWE